MRIESDEGFISLIAENDAEVAMLAPLAPAINGSDKSLPAQLVDNLENGPDNRLINGILQIQVGG